MNIPGQYPNRSARRHVFGRIEIDVSGHRVFVSGSQVMLEPKAFAVLVLLAGDAGRVFTRDEILDAIWQHRHVTPGVLNRIITLVRHALGEHAKHPCHLHTVHGVGYRFDMAEHRRASQSDGVGQGLEYGHATPSLQTPLPVSGPPGTGEWLPSQW